MRLVFVEFPRYSWHKNKGYDTWEHCRAIEEHGLCRYHCKSFDIKSAQLELFSEEILQS